MIYRLLPAEEFSKLPEIMGQLNPDVCYMAVAEQEGRVVGTLGFTLQPHLDGFWIDPAERGKVDWRRLWEALEPQVSSYKGLRLFAAPTFSNGPKMLKIVGFLDSQERIMVKEF